VLELRVAAAQINAVVGDLVGNAERVLDAYERAVAEACDLVVFPELTVTGYPPEDLLLKPAFVAEAAETVAKIAARTGACAVVVGFPERVGAALYNAAAVCANGEIIGVYRKQRLPNYSVFDEQRYFTPSTDAGRPIFEFKGMQVAVTICEDAWSPEPIREMVLAGAELIVNINASPYFAGRLPEREAMLAGRARDESVQIVYVNLVGGEDVLVFDGE
jgi:NAD+ synthase (glutamine-hydrolysing)